MVIVDRLPLLTPASRLAVILGNGERNIGRQVYILAAAEVALLDLTLTSMQLLIHVRGSTISHARFLIIRKCGTIDIQSHGAWSVFRRPLLLALLFTYILDYSSISLKICRPVLYCAGDIVSLSRLPCTQLGCRRHLHAYSSNPKVQKVSTISSKANVSSIKPPRSLASRYSAVVNYKNGPC